MERNLNKILLDIQKLYYSINNYQNIDLYKDESKRLRSLLDKIVYNMDEYSQYVKLNPEELKRINNGYQILDRIDLDIYNLEKPNQIQKTKIPFSFRSFLLFILVTSIIYFYFSYFIKYP
jgi:hypothetical protein